MAKQPDGIALGENTKLGGKLSPNPVDHELVTIETNSDAQLVVQVFSMSGILVGEANLQGQTSLLNLSGLPSGTYSVHIAAGHEVVVAKITKS